MFKNEFEHSNKKVVRPKSEEKLHQRQGNHDKEIEIPKGINNSTQYGSSDFENNITEKMFEIYDLEIEQKYECTFAQELETKYKFLNINFEHCKSSQFNYSSFN